MNLFRSFGCVQKLQIAVVGLWAGPSQLCCRVTLLLAQEDGSFYWAVCPFVACISAGFGPSRQLISDGNKSIMPSSTHALAWIKPLNRKTGITFRRHLHVVVDSLSLQVGPAYQWPPHPIFSLTSPPPLFLSLSFISSSSLTFLSFFFLINMSRRIKPLEEVNWSNFHRWRSLYTRFCGWGLQFDFGNSWGR